MQPTQALELPELKAGRPAWRQIAEWLKSEISSGRLAPGDRLPSEVDLAAALGVSRMTLRAGLAPLERSGLVRREHGRKGGTFIAQPKLACDLTNVAGLSKRLRRVGVRATAQVLTARSVGAPCSVAGALGIDEGDEVAELVRIRSARDEPFVLERSFLPVSLFPGFLEQRLDGSLYELLTGTYGRSPVRAFEALESVQALEAEADLLGVEVDSPLLLVERVSYESTGTAIEYGRDLYRGDRARLTFWSGQPRLVPVEPEEPVDPGQR